MYYIGFFFLFLILPFYELFVRYLLIYEIILLIALEKWKECWKNSKQSLADNEQLLLTFFFLCEC